MATHLLLESGVPDLAAPGPRCPEALRLPPTVPMVLASSKA
jgi:hypothetical protein